MEGATPRFAWGRADFRACERAPRTDRLAAAAARIGSVTVQTDTESQSVQPAMPVRHRRLGPRDHIAMHVSPLDPGDGGGAGPFAPEASTESRSPPSSGGRRRLRAGAPRNRSAAPGSVAQLEAILNEHREHEKTLKSTLLAAPEAGGRHQGRCRRRSTADHPRGPGAVGVCCSRRHRSRVEDIQREIDGLKLKRRDVETSIEASIQTLRNYARVRS